MLIGYIYCISNDINNKKYVGKTVRSIQERFKEHCKDSKRAAFEKRPLYRAMNKYGVEHFFINLLETAEISKLEEREQYWIKKLNTYHDGYNATIGGDGKILYDYEAFVVDYNKGLLVKEIATKYGCDTHTVTVALQASNINSKLNRIKQVSHIINQYDKNGNFIQKFNSQNDAARYLIEQGHKGSRSSICTNIGRVLKGKRKTAEGYIWKYDNS